MKYPEQHDYHMLMRMIELAMQAHEEQFDMAQRPYFLHPLTVMQSIADHYDDDFVLMQIAMGHDLIEDTWVTKEHLENAGFSERVVDAIVALSKREGLSYKDYKKQVLASEDAMRVKFYDISHNMDIGRLGRIPTEKDLKRQELYKQFRDEIVVELEKYS